MEGDGVGLSMPIKDIAVPKRMYALKIYVIRIQKKYVSRNPIITQRKYLHRYIARRSLAEAPTRREFLNQAF